MKLSSSAGSVKVSRTRSTEINARSSAGSVKVSRTRSTEINARSSAGSVKISLVAPAAPRSTPAPAPAA